MTILKIEHAITDFETWRRAFERDPVGRQACGVRRYRVYRPVDDERYVLVHLDFDGPGDAGAFLEKLEGVWSRAELSPGLLRSEGPAALQRGRILEEVACHTYPTP